MCERPRSTPPPSCTPCYNAAVTPLEPPDTHHLRAAEGWLELGSHAEANAELDRIRPTFRAHPDVLRLRWYICADTKSWDLAVEVASTLVGLQPGNAEHWLHRSYALHELKQTCEARDLLLPAAGMFPDGDAIRYNLACYECQLGNLPKAKDWLAQAFALANCKELKLDALKDPDLELLWPHIAAL